MKRFVGGVLVFCSSYLHAASYVVSNTSSDPMVMDSLPYAVGQANAHPGSTITFSSIIDGATINLTVPLLITSNCTIDGDTHNITVSGETVGAKVRPFFINPGLTSVVISNLTIQDGLAQGGAGGSVEELGSSGAGGGGGGLGGGCFVDSSLTLTNVSFSNNQAIGGAGGSIFNSESLEGAGGGGGLGGAGGTSNFSMAGSGGGGQLVSQAGSSATGSSGGMGGGSGGNGGDEGSAGDPGGRYGGGGGGGATGGLGTPATAGGAGGYGGGGGGEGDSDGSTAGAGGGNGGVGGGGGGASAGSYGRVATSAFGGGNGGSNPGIDKGLPGGGGAGLGGALFVAESSTLTPNTVTLVYTTPPVGGAFMGNSVTGGAAGAGGAETAAAGSALGADIFIDKNSTLIFNLSSGVTLNPAIASNTNGLCVLQNIGAGVLDLSAAQPFAATIDLNAGTISIASDANLGVSTGPYASTLNFDGGTLETTATFSSNRSIAIAASGATIQTTSGTWTEAGAIAGIGDLTKTGSGRLILSNPSPNTYSGFTMVSSGTLQVGANGTLPSGTAVTVASGSTLDLHGHTQTIGSLAGSGSVTLSSLLSAGVLTISGGGSYGGEISDNILQRGSLVVSGSTLTLTQANSYRGGTIIQNGATLALSGAGELASNGPVEVDGTFDIHLAMPATNISIGPLSGSGSVELGSNTLVVNTSVPLLPVSSTFSGGITGTGGLTKAGNSYTLTLSGSSDYSGATTVSAGTLVVGVGGVGSLTSSPVTVESGGTLKGTGTIGQLVTVQGGGTIHGGNSVGTIHLNSLTLLPDANLTLEIDNVPESTIYQVTGSAAIAGNLLVTVDRGAYAEGTSYRFITTGAHGRTGAFQNVISNISGTTPLVGMLNYGPDFVELLLTASIYPIIPLNGLQGNALALANYLNRFASNPALQPVLLAIGALPPDQEQAALTSISPARNAISSWTAQNTLFGVSMAVVSRMLQQRYMRGVETNEPAFASLLNFEDQLIAAKNPPYGKARTAAKEKSRYAVWAEGVGLFARQNAIHENPAFHSSTGCGLIGADFYDFSQGQVGAAIGYAQSNIEEAGTGSGSIQSYIAGIYGTVYLCNSYVELGLWGAFDQFHNKRNVFYPGFSAVAQSNHNGWQLIEHCGVGYDFNFCWGALEPFTSFDAAALFQQEYSEHGAGVLDMNVKASTSWLLRTEAGVNAYQIKKCAPGTLVFRETLSYVNLAPFATGKLSGTSLIGYPPGFTVTSFTDVQNMVSPGFEVFFKCNNGFFTSLAYDGEFTVGPGRYMSNEAIVKIGGFF